MKKPKPIKVEIGPRFCVAEPWINPLTGACRPEDIDRSKAALTTAMVQAGKHLDDFDLRWEMIESSWGWVARERG